MELDDEADAVTTLPAGRIASFFYLKHSTMATWSHGLAAHMEPREVSLPLWCFDTQCFTWDCCIHVAAPWLVQECIWVREF